MKNARMPNSYIGREQAYVKHTILKTYLQRLFMIIGRSKEPVINYIDCFSGPWQEEDEKLSDTSIGISLQQMQLCQQGLQQQFGTQVKFRALYIEKDRKAFQKLKQFLSNNPYPTIETACLNGDYTELLEEIVAWTKYHFSFFFIDPKGWKNVVDAKTMLPLLQLNKAEFLINLMYDFINRFITHDEHENTMLDIFGTIPEFNNETPDRRQQTLVSLYRNNMKQHFQGRTTYVPVEKPGTSKVLYYLIYLTRHSKGIDVFKTEAEKMEIVQRITQKEFKLRRQLEQANTMDMFTSSENTLLQQEDLQDNRYAAREYLLRKLKQTPTLIDYEKWADFLEESDLYPTDFQQAAKELIKENRIKNLDDNVARRRTNIIRPDWPNKSEHWLKL